MALTGTLPVEVLIKSAPGLDGDLGRLADQVGLLQLTGFDDHFQQHVGRLTSLLALFHQLEADLFVAGDQRAVREHHVHFIRAIGDGRAGFRQRDVDIVVAMREVGHGGDTDIRRALLTQRLARYRDKTRVNADGRRVAGRAVGLTTEGDHFLVGVIIIQRG